MELSIKYRSRLDDVLTFFFSFFFWEGGREGGIEGGKAVFFSER
jgi:hypothetical protein